LPLDGGYLDKLSPFWSTVENKRKREDRERPPPDLLHRLLSFGVWNIESKITTNSFQEARSNKARSYFLSNKKRKNHIKWPAAEEQCSQGKKKAMLKFDTKIRKISTLSED
jgi:hypothetical protein